MRKNLLIVLFSVISLALHAQDRLVSGKVTDETGEGLPGVNIMKAGTSEGVISDVDGNFSLEANSADVLRFSYVGYVQEEVTVGNQSVLNVTLMPDVTTLTEVVVVGYGSTTKKELTGAVSKVGSKAIEERQVPRIDQALQGQVSGVNVTTNSGAPGGSANIRIRGLSTNGDNNPLILVDGVVYSAEGLNALNPADIESVNILKDATASIYGVLGANGVLLIETKKGQTGQKPTFEFNGYYGLQEAARRLDLLNAREYAILKNEAFAAGGQPLPFNNTELGEGTDWQDKVFEQAPIQNYNFGVSGGSEKTTYNIGGSYFDQEGIVGGNRAKFERYNGRLNFVTELAPRVKLTHVLLYTHEKSRGVSESAIGSVLYNAVNAYPTEPVTIDGRYSYLDNVADIINPVAQLANTHNNAIVNKFVGKEEISYKINDQFTLNGRGGYNYAIVDSKTFNPLVWYGPGKYANSAANENLDPVIVNIGDLEIERGANVYEERNTYLNYNLEGFLNYETTLDAHTVKGMLGLAYLSWVNSGLNGTGFNIPNNSLDLADISANQAPNGYLNNVGSFQDKKVQNSIFFRGEYDYKKKYLLSGIVRRDGSSVFGSNNKFGFFYSGSAAWVFSEEPFFNLPFVDFAKLRASYGKIGNDQIGLFSYRANLNGEGVYVFNNLITQGAAIGQAANPDLKWETTYQTNIGLDLTILGKFDLTANYFIKQTNDLLFQPDVSAILGTYGAGSSPPIINGGNVKNTGVELDLGYTVRGNNGLTFSANYNITYLKNEVTKVPEGFNFIPGAGFSVGGAVATRFEKGYPIGYFIGYETDGIFQTAEEIASSDVVQPGAQPGDLRFVDQNGDGRITFGDDADRTMIGSPLPDFTMGLNLNAGYMGFDLSANMYAALGQEIIRNYERQQPYANMLSYNINRWTGPGSTDEYPRLTTGATQNTVFSDFYVEDGSFARLRNITLGYTLPGTLTKTIGVRSLRFYISANNLITLTKYQGYDPDLGATGVLTTGVDLGRYPQARVYMGGINLTF